MERAVPIRIRQKVQAEQLLKRMPHEIEKRKNDS
jgi:hypothetical protein